MQNTLKLRLMLLIALLLVLSACAGSNQPAAPGALAAPGLR
jgi:outer membrane lipoprotein-sorting protein